MLRFAALISLTLCFASVSAQWTPIATPTHHILNDIGFSDALHGYCVGDKGTVLRSTDGGHTWTTTQVDSLPLMQMHFLDSLRGFVRSTRHIYRTVDGINFVKMDSIMIPPADSVITYVLRLANMAFRGKHGVIMGAFGDSAQTVPLKHRAWKTSDYGETWQALSESPSYIAYVQIVDSMHWFSASMQYARTRDGGQSWDTAPNITFGFPPLNDQSWRVFDTTGAGVISMAYHLDFAQIDGFSVGITPLANVYNVISMDYVDTMGHYLIWQIGGNDAVFRKTVDRGQSFTHAGDTLPGALAIDFLDANTGWACGHNGQVYLTTTGGGTLATRSITSARIQIYPNPSHGLLNFATKERLEQLDILNTSGQLLYSEVVVKNNQADLRFLSPGNYVVRMRTSNAEYVSQVVIH